MKRKKERKGIVRELLFFVGDMGVDFPLLPFYFSVLRA
jgi:hypothetical protein